jgi:hypothetical protein
MEILSSRITRLTEKHGHCVIYENELQNIWPLDEEDREKRIAQFAREYGFHLSFYKQGRCAVFVKQPPSTSALRIAAALAESHRADE